MLPQQAIASRAAIVAELESIMPSQEKCADRVQKLLAFKDGIKASRQDYQSVVDEYTSVLQARTKSTYIDSFLEEYPKTIAFLSTKLGGPKINPDALRQLMMPLVQKFSERQDLSLADGDLENFLEEYRKVVDSVSAEFGLSKIEPDVVREFIIAYMKIISEMPKPSLSDSDLEDLISEAQARISRIDTLFPLLEQVTSTHGNYVLSIGVARAAILSTDKTETELKAMKVAIENAKSVYVAKKLELDTQMEKALDNDSGLPSASLQPQMGLLV